MAGAGWWPPHGFLREGCAEESPDFIGQDALLGAP
jgi:hypothetical protein